MALGAAGRCVHGGNFNRGWFSANVQRVNNHMTMTNTINNTRISVTRERGMPFIRPPPLRDGPAPTA
jgi:hypothetical protein